MLGMECSWALWPPLQFRQASLAGTPERESQHMRNQQEVLRLILASIGGNRVHRVNTQ